MDDETRQYFKALSAQIQGLKESQDHRLEQFDHRLEQFDHRLEQFDRRFEDLKEYQDRGFEQLKRYVDAKVEALNLLIESVKDSLEREIRIVHETDESLEVRVRKVSAGAHYVTKLVEWSDKQDDFRSEILRRVQALEMRLDKLDKSDDRPEQ